MVEVTTMREEHLDAILAIENESFVFPWTRKSMLAELERVNRGMAYYYVGLVDGKVAGYGGMWHVVTEGHITNIAVKDEFRRMGVGDAIVAKMLETADEKDMLGVTLEVRVSNEAALALYKKHGFTLEGLRKEYYEDNKEDAYIMWKYLIPVENIL
jgi:ribosomal-protein-alanine N-acetyltransferase